MQQTTCDSKTIRHNDHEDILGQFYYAFGQGAGTMRVQRSAIAALRARYLGPIKAVTDSWSGMASNVLDFVVQVGRLSALLATQDGRTFINEQDFMTARRKVEASVHRRADDKFVLIAGPVCPAYPGDDESDPSTQEVPTFAPPAAVSEPAREEPRSTRTH